MQRNKLSIRRDDWKFEKNNPTIALNSLYAQKQKYLAYVSEHHSKRKKQVIILMIPNGKRCHYIAVKNYHDY